jgi:hypothetical protein
MMAKMSLWIDTELKAMLAAEKADALAAMYRGPAHPNPAPGRWTITSAICHRTCRRQDGRSKAVSTDVADTIEG